MSGYRSVRNGLCDTLAAILLLLAMNAANTASGQTKTGLKEKESLDCAPSASWSIPGGGKLAESAVIAQAAKQSVVLLGEMHDNPDHHRWQLQTLAALHAVRPGMVIGFEMFPRRVH